MRTARLQNRLAIGVILGVFAVLTGDGGPAQALPLDAGRIEIAWSPPAGTERIKVMRDGRVVDDFRHTGRLVYVDHLLWEETSYVFDLTAYSEGGMLSHRRIRARTPSREEAPARPFSAESFWNQPIGPDPPLDPDSEAYVRDALVAYADAANFANTEEWGIPIVVANPVTDVYEIGCTTWGCEEDVEFPIPTGAEPTTGSDHHLAVIDMDSDRKLGMWEARYDARADAWIAGSRYALSSEGPGVHCEGCGGAVAAGFALSGGVIRPEEIAEGWIDHALVFTTPFTHSSEIRCPATNTDGTNDDPTALPQGARIQLDPNFDVDGQDWAEWKKIVARALQEYGAFLGDTAGSLAIRGEAVHNRGYDAWEIVGVPHEASLANLPWEHFRVIDAPSC